MAESFVKDKIMDVASRLFFEQGYNLTGINQIIEEAGIARGSLYNHFESKTQLLLAYLAKAQQERLDEMAAFVAPAGDPEKKLLALFDYRIDRQQRLGYKGCQFIKICAEVDKEDAAVFELVEGHKEQVRAFIRGIIRDIGRREEKKQILSDELLADMVFLLIEGGTSSVVYTRNVKNLKSGRKIAEKLI